MAYSKIVFITNDEYLQAKEFSQIDEYIMFNYKLPLELKSYNENITQQIESSVLCLLYLSDTQVKYFLKNHLNSAINIGILPTKESSKVVKSYGISKDVFEAIDDAFNQSKVSKIDLLTCNGEPTFSSIVIGNIHGLNRSLIEGNSLYSKMEYFYNGIKNISFQEYIFTTAKEQVIQTAAAGIMVLEHNLKSANHNLIYEDLSLHDGKLNAFILAPTNILSYLYYLISVFFYSRFTLSSIPKSIGTIKTSKLKISSPKPMDFQLDGTFMSAKEIELEVLKDSINITFGRNIQDVKAEKFEEENDTIKTQFLPKGELKIALLSEPIPFLKRAGEEDFKELFIALRESAKTSSVYIVLMVLSTLLATTGLFQNSTPVIIGAMILAPLMAPIVSLAMGVVRAENSMITSSLKTLFFGILTALLFSSIYTYFMPLETLTEEMRGRLNPNILDLMVAIISGIAAAYAYSKSEVAKSLAGVAIAVALIPPLSVAGIGIGWGSFEIIYGSFLLFTTNLVGITLSASFTFLVLGYSPVHRAKKGLVYASVILSIVTIPLVISFANVIKQNNIIHRLDNTYYVVNEKPVNVNVLEVYLGKKVTTLYIQTLSNDVLNQGDFNLLKENIQNQVGKKVVLNISSKLVIK